MRLKQFKKISFFHKSGVSILLIAGILGGCSSDFSRFTDGIEKSSSKQVQQNNSSGQTYPQAPRQDNYGRIQSEELPSPQADNSQNYNSSQSQNSYNNQVNTHAVSYPTSENDAEEGYQHSNGSSKKYVTHKVKAGDTLSGIAARYSADISSLRSHNNIYGDRILIGQVLEIPSSKDNSNSNKSVSDSFNSSDDVNSDIPIPTPEPAPSYATSQNSTSVNTGATGDQNSDMNKQVSENSDNEIDEESDVTDSQNSTDSSVEEDKDAATVERDNDKTSEDNTSSKTENSQNTSGAAQESNKTEAQSNNNTKQQDAAPMIWPVKGSILSNYGQRTGTSSNDGIDIAVSEGTKVLAADSGTVIYAGDGLREFGNTVLIRHDGNLVTVYGHNSKLMVQRGQQIKRGDVIALSGHSGNASRAQLHFEVRKNSAPVDPVKYLPKLN